MQPTPEQISSWLETVNTPDRIEKANLMQVGHMAKELAKLAYAAGATAGVNSCLNYLLEIKSQWCDSAVEIIDQLVDELHNTMFPKPPSLKQQALEALELLLHDERSGVDVAPIRRALESLPDN